MLNYSKSTQKESYSRYAQFTKATNTGESAHKSLICPMSQKYLQHRRRKSQTSIQQGDRKSNKSYAALMQHEHEDS